ncbi:sentrin/SUMO-specific protease [Purpureocillium lilacinum]|uniref:Sentrin/SUMO-specific protease n=1 Tax=Purpureocillium lilacinum TaxID=33203 RepID=A0A179HMQ0_PURLI|nr:sentrin/SUMO-specific protease [Purpureocillium lilacinum]OAQ90739.1 sentrin/SUMO-specific protease [Purpureocillium lilacinum]
MSDSPAAQQQQQPQPQPQPVVQPQQQQPGNPNQDAIDAVRAAFVARRRQSVLSLRRLGVPRANRVVPIIQAINAARHGAPSVRYRPAAASQPDSVPTRSGRVFARPKTRFVIDTVYPFANRQRLTSLRQDDSDEEPDTAAPLKESQATINHRRQHKELLRKAAAQVTLTVPAPAPPAAPQPPTEQESDSDEDVFTIEPAATPSTTGPPSVAASHVAIEPAGHHQQAHSHPASVSTSPATPEVPTAEPASLAAPGQASSAPATFHFGNQQVGEQANSASQPGATGFAPHLQQHLPSYLPALRAFGARVHPDAPGAQTTSSEHRQSSNPDEPGFVAPRRMHLPRLRDISTWVMAGVRDAVTRVGGRVTGLARTTSNNATRIRRRATGAALNAARRTLEFSNKRLRVEAPDPTRPHWRSNEEALKTMVLEKEEFFRVLFRIGQTVEHSRDQVSMNRRLRFLRPSLLRFDAETQPHSSDQESDLIGPFLLHLSKCINICRKIYNVNTFFRLKRNNPSFQAAAINYDLNADDVRNVEQAEAFMAAPALPATCNDILQVLGLDPSELLPKDQFDAILLDLRAVLAHLPMPSFVVSKRYQKQMQLFFPSPIRSSSDWEWTIPGSFPQDELESEDQDVAASQPAPPSEAAVAPVTSSPSPQVQRSDMSGASRMRADLLEAQISDMSDAQYRAAFYNESEQHRLIAKKYVRKFEPKEPRHDSQPLGSILKNRKKLPGQGTPKRLRMTRAPKIVRFKEGTLSPQQRSHAGLDVPKRPGCKRRNGGKVLPVTPTRRPGARPNFFMRNGAAPDTKVEEREIESPLPPVRKDYPSWLRHPSRAVADKAEEKAEADARIQALMELPTPAGLARSGTVSIVVERMKTEAAHKAAEKAQREEEERKEARRIAREAAEAERKAESERKRIEEEKRKAEEERRRQEFIRNIDQHRQLRAPKKPFITAPEGPELAKANSILNGTNSSGIFVTTPEGAGLRKHDFASVIPSTNWLNDEIINGSIVFLDRSINEAAGIKDFKQQTRKCLALNSFFFKSLLESGTKGVIRKLKRHGVHKDNFLDLETILMPVCSGNHWTLIVIRPKMRTVAHMDSLNPAGNQHYVDVAMNFVRFVLEGNYEESLWKTVRHDAPRQTNGYDCGVFTITNAICLALGLSPIDSYSATDMETQRKRIACILLNKGFHGEYSVSEY